MRQETLQDIFDTKRESCIKIDLPRSMPIHGPLEPSPPRTQKTALLIGDDAMMLLDATKPLSNILCTGRFMRDGRRHDDSLEETASADVENKAR
jgi:hypothetical protein